MADIYNVNADNIVGGAGRLVVANYGITYPERISDVMDLTDPYNLKPGWTDLGATTEGITISRGFETEDFEVDQVTGPVDSDITSWEHSLETNLAENTVENRKLALVGSTIIQTPPTYGTATTLNADVSANATIITVASAVDIFAGSYIDIDGEVIKVASVQGNTIYLESGLSEAKTTTASVTPITELGTKRIAYGTPNEVPYKTYALISQKKDGTLYMAVIRKAKVSGDAKDQTFGKEKRTLPFQLAAYPDGDVNRTENVYYELEQTATVTP